MSVSPKDESVSTITVSELELETALLRSLPEVRPIGRHKHLLIMQLQGEIHRRTGIWMEVADMWDRLGELYDLEALDEMSSSSSVSLPASPTQLSPLILPSKPTPFSLPTSTNTSTRPRPSARRSSASLSPLSSASCSASPTKAPPHPRSPWKKKSSSAGVINSAHFFRNFELPYVGAGVNEDEEGVWRELVYPRAEAAGEDEGGWPDEGTFRGEGEEDAGVRRGSRGYTSGLNGSLGARHKAETKPRASNGSRRESAGTVTSIAPSAGTKRRRGGSSSLSEDGDEDEEKDLGAAAERDGDRGAPRKSDAKRKRKEVGSVGKTPRGDEDGDENGGEADEGEEGGEHEVKEAREKGNMDKKPDKRRKRR